MFSIFDHFKYARIKPPVSYGIENLVTNHSADYDPWIYGGASYEDLGGGEFSVTLGASSSGFGWDLKPDVNTSLKNMVFKVDVLGEGTNIGNDISIGASNLTGQGGTDVFGGYTPYTTLTGSYQTVEIDITFNQDNVGGTLDIEWVDTNGAAAFKVKNITIYIAS
jgi:hypothetical protein